MKQKTLILGIGIALISLLLINGCGQKQTQPTTQIKDCNDDFGCFVLASETCTPAKVNNKITTNIFGVLQETDSDYELKRSDAGKCIFSLKTNHINLRYSEELLKMMKDGGVPQEQIDQQLQQTKDQYKTFIGKEGNCGGDSTVISSMLKRWEQGTFSTSDWDNLECSGPYFEQMNTDTPFGKVKSTITQKGDSTNIKVSIGDTSERECLFSEDCKDGFHCMNKECISNGIIDSFQDCVNNECTQGCTNCQKEKYSCMLSSEAFKDNKCVECFMDSQCNSGYACKSYLCVKE